MEGHAKEQRIIIVKKKYFKIYYKIKSWALMEHPVYFHLS